MWPEPGIPHLHLTFIFPVQRHSPKVLAFQRRGVGLGSKAGMRMGHGSFQRTAQGGTMLSVLNNYGSHFLHPFPIFLPPFHHHHPLTGLNCPSNDTLKYSTWHLRLWPCLETGSSKMWAHESEITLEGGLVFSVTGKWGCLGDGVQRRSAAKTVTVIDLIEER